MAYIIMFLCLSISVILEEVIKKTNYGSKKEGFKV